MTETLRLARTLGRKGWDVAHGGSAGAFTLAAVGRSVAQRRPLSSLPLLWRLRALWRSSLTALDPSELRLAVAIDSRVRLSGVSIKARITAPATGEAPGARAPASVEASLPLVVVRVRDARLPALDGGLAWREFALAADSVKNFRRLVRAIATSARDARVDLRISARESRAPAVLRPAFPLRIEMLADAKSGYQTLVPLIELDLTGD